MTKNVLKVPISTRLQGWGVGGMMTKLVPKILNQFKTVTCFLHVFSDITVTQKENVEDDRMRISARYVSASYTMLPMLDAMS